MYTRKYDGEVPITRFVGEFARLFAQLESMGMGAQIREAHKAPWLLASLSNWAQLEIIVAAIRLKILRTLHVTL